MYIDLASNLIEHQVFSLSQQAPFLPEVFRTPGYPAFLALIRWSGMENPYWTVFWQELVYASTVWIFYHYGKTVFDRNLQRAGLLFLLLDPGGLVYPKLFLSETLFLPFLVSGMLAMGYYLRDKNWRYLALAGVIMGVGAIVRPAILYLPLIAAVTLLVSNFKNKRRWLDAGILLLTFFLVIAPWLLRNHHYFGKAFMSGQQSHMIANYHVTKVWEHTRGITQAQGQAEIHRLVALEKIKLEELLGKELTRVEFFNLQLDVAVSELSEYPLDYALHWASGMVKTIVGPNLIEFYDIFNIHPQRPHLFATVENKGLLKGVLSYLKNMDYVFFLNVVLTLAMGIFALFGALSIVTKKDCFLWLLLLANCYFISMAGPMGEPRYRFPVGVFWFIQAYLGFRWLVVRWQRFRFGVAAKQQY
jgi:4-amino-4-deoxy-L-arabinose transferase-like glycosyltransferase